MISLTCSPVVDSIVPRSARLREWQMSTRHQGALSSEALCTGTQTARLSHALDHTKANTLSL